MKPRSWWCLGISCVVMVVIVVVIVLLVVPRSEQIKTQRYRRAVVVANGNECATIGRNILEQGGSAVDAAIATLFCDGISCAQCTGLGGGFLAVVHDAVKKRTRVLNARERAPAAAYPGMYDKASSIVGGLAVAVPAQLRGYGALHREYGKLEWKKLVEPSIQLIRQGFRVSKCMAYFLKRYNKEIYREPSLRDVYVNPITRDVWKEGDLIRDPLFARTLDRIAKEGPEAIHNGSMTEALVRDIQNFGGIVTESDLRNYRPIWQDPIVVPLSEKLTLRTVPLPGSGSVLAFILHMVKGWIGSGTNVKAYSSLYWHRLIETFKYAYAKRSGLGDPGHIDLPYDIRELESNLTSPEWATSFRELVDDAHTSNDWKHYGAFYEGEEDHGTAHIVVCAPDGSAVSVTSTVNYIWGAQRRSPSLGFILNNQMSDFSISDPANQKMHISPANSVKAGLQPLSSMVPSIVFARKDHVRMVIGAAGGPMITTQVAVAIMQTLFERDDYDKVIRRPRIHHQLLPMEVQYESSVPKRFDPHVLKSLRARGHVTKDMGPDVRFAIINGALRNRQGYWVTEKDPRRNGSIDGF